MPVTDAQFAALEARVAALEGPAPKPAPHPCPVPEPKAPTGREVFTADFAKGWGGFANMQTRDRNGSPGDYSSYSASIRDGGDGHPTAARFEVRPGDVPNFGGGERSELRFPGSVDCREGDERIYDFAIKFDPPWRPSSSWWCIVMQWHSNSGSPALTFSAERNGDRLMLVGNSHVLGANGYNTAVGAIDAGVWHQYRLRVRFSRRKADGFVEVHRDGKLTLPRTPAQTMISDANYTKMGIYRGATPHPQTVWFDGIRVTAP